MNAVSRNDVPGLRVVQSDDRTELLRTNWSKLWINDYLERDSVTEEFFEVATKLCGSIDRRRANRGDFQFDVLSRYLAYLRLAGPWCADSDGQLDSYVGDDSA